MTIPLWSLLGFASWTLAVLMIGVGVSRWSKILTRRAQLTDFPADQPHGSVRYRRIIRAHANCIENLPVFAVIVFTAALAGYATDRFDLLAQIVLAGRVLQSMTHMMFAETNLTVGIRFSFFLLQIICMVWMAADLALFAL